MHEKWHESKDESKTLISGRHAERKIEIAVGSIVLEQMDHFKYLGAPIDGNSSCKREMKSRISLTYSTLGQIGEIETVEFLDGLSAFV